MGDRTKYILIFIFFVFSIIPRAKGQVIEDYASQVRIEEEGRWLKVPVVAKVMLELGDFPKADIALAVPANAAVFINGVMWFFAKSDTSVTVNSEVLRRNFPSNGTSRELAIFKRGINKGDIFIQKGIFEKGSWQGIAEDNVNWASHREKDEVEEFFFIAILVVFLLISLFKVIYPVVLSFTIRPGSVFSTEDFTESNSIRKFFSEEILFFLLIFNMLLMLLAMVSVYYVDVDWLKGYMVGDLDYMFLIWLSGTGVLLLISLLRFIWLKISAKIFRIKRFEFTHFFYMLRIASVIMVLIFSILIVCLTNNFFEKKAMMNFLLYGFFFIYIFGILMLFLMMTKKVSFKNYHLFSYLCTAELIPFLVLSKLIVG